MPKLTFETSQGFYLSTSQDKVHSFLPQGYDWNAEITSLITLGTCKHSRHVQMFHTLSRAAFIAMKLPLLLIRLPGGTVAFPCYLSGGLRCRNNCHKSSAQGLRWNGSSPKGYRRSTQVTNRKYTAIRIELHGGTSPDGMRIHLYIRGWPVSAI